MTNVNSAFTNALLADAAYVMGLTSASNLAVDLRPRMTPELAAHIAKNFSVVTQIETGGLSSFDATVWRANTASGAVNPNGMLYVTMRGTQETADFLVDINLAVTGSAQAQLVSMVNWWFKISTPAGQSATQIRTNIGGGMIGQFFEAAPPVLGTGLISASNLIGGIEVNGHSLGGYLSSAFTRLFGNQGNVAHTSALNSAGFAPGSEAVFTQLQNLIGVSYGLGRFPSQAEQTNYFAKHGLNVTTNSFWFSH